MELSEIICTKEEGIATITFNRPDAMNSLTGGMFDEILAALDDAKRDPATKVVVFTGAGKAFCAGADVKGLSNAKANDSRRTYPPITTASDARDFGNLGIQRIPRALKTFSKPVIASVNGAAIGAGMDFVSMCDWRIASDKARFGITHLRAGRLSTDGGYYFLSRILGAAKTLELAWTNRIFDAEEALRIGYINKLVPHDQLASETKAFALMLAQGPSVAIEMAKKLIYEGLDSSLDHALKDVEFANAICYTTEDATEGPKALTEKRPPKFKGR